ncbi:hypothetical protein IMG5_047490 [Ichthyophthirius multifiliis]|uniref:Chromo domain-containing protein n=1 Tax=Ichthyophthirius multifiliis TaxID=5932 RepID=G0QMB8_ICHMU|nr:hypothetical protein IMG5_047490 [Ichthyophthirius multifiliis]EGR33640.1 hypothetical protein IMG5_047490 [Ichthyophthirius multifiliis]|eukprot:XP_004037626.1 hypothetical protein IMG5_047490 [Ichthyophthirius multifiliis]
MDLYEIQQIKKIRYIDGKLQFFIKWKGWHEKHNTWEPFENLKNCTWAIQQYSENNKINARANTKAWDTNNPFLSQITDKICNIQQGSLLIKDIPLKIVDIQKNPNDPEDFIYEVSWSVRKNKEQPLNTWVPGRELKPKYPDIIFKYYEQLIVFQ